MRGALEIWERTMVDRRGPFFWVCWLTLLARGGLQVVWIVANKVWTDLKRSLKARHAIVVRDGGRSEPADWIRRDFLGNKRRDNNTRECGRAYCVHVGQLSLYCCVDGIRYKRAEEAASSRTRSPSPSLTLISRPYSPAAPVRDRSAPPQI